MLKVEILDIDELYSILLDLCSITYLQSTIIDESENNNLFQETEFSIENIRYYLLEKQIETVLRFIDLFNNEDFATK